MTAPDGAFPPDQSNYLNQSALGPTPVVRAIKRSGVEALLKKLMIFGLGELLKG
jgi:hypothetical protein